MEYGSTAGKYGLKITDNRGQASTNWYVSERDRDREFDKKEKLMKRSWASNINKVEKVIR